MIYMYTKEATMIAVRMPEDIEKRLDELAKATGRTKTYYVREAVLEYLDDLEDLYLAEKELKKVRSGEKTYTLEEAKKALGLED